MGLADVSLGWGGGWRFGGVAADDFRIRANNAAQMLLLLSCANVTYRNRKVEHVAVAALQKGTFSAGVENLCWWLWSKREK